MIWKFNIEIEIEADTPEQAVLNMAALSESTNITWSIAPGEQYNILVDACNVFYGE